MKTNILKRLLAVIMVLCMVVPMLTAFAADNTTCSITVSITDNQKGRVLTDTSSKYLTGASPLAAEVVTLIEKNYDDLEVFRSPGMKRIMDYGLRAFAESDAQKWTGYLNRYYKDVNSDLKTLLSDKAVSLSALEPRKHYSVEFTNDVRGDRTYGVTYTVTVTRYLDGQVDADPATNGLADLLVADNHIAYMQGDNHGNFEPGDHITRAETAQMFYNLLKDKNVASTTTFQDVPSNVWYAPAVNAIAALGLIEGDGKGSFRPQDKITRAEFVAIGARFATAVEGTHSFTDMAAASWAEDEITTAVSYGWVEGYGNGTFKPTAYITRAEAATVVCRMLERQPDEAYIDANVATLKSFPDVAKDKWYYYNVMEATNGHEHDYTTGGAEFWTALK